MEQLGSHWTDLQKFLISENFSKICPENSNSVEIGQEKWALYMKTNIHILSYLAHFFLE
jgi:hypothetical protein